MVSLWILNKKISGSIVSASRHAIREAPLSIVPLSDPAQHHWASQTKQHLQKQRDKKTPSTSFCKHPSDVFLQLHIYAGGWGWGGASSSTATGLEWLWCNGVRGLDECGYLCWKHWDAGQFSIRLHGAKPSMWTTRCCSSKPQPHHLHPELLVRTHSTCFSATHILFGVRQSAGVAFRVVTMLGSVIFISW